MGFISAITSEFRSTKARMKERAGLELAHLIIALDRWNADRSDFEGLTQALHHFLVYENRRADYSADPTGLTLPAERAVLASFWIEHLMDARLLDDSGRPSRWHEQAGLFWDSIEELRSEHDRLMASAVARVL